MKKRWILIALIAMIILAMVFVLPSDPVIAAKMVVYKSPSCSCCGGYISYSENKIGGVETVLTDNVDAIKNDAGIPGNMRSCHTSLIGGYFVEGHVPIEAIQKLLDEQPDLDGITLPNMPAGSPGMGGVKQEPFTIYGVKDGVVSEFMKV